ncbi:10468_t:CDS:2, partial [Gigaspora rosea]
MSKRKLSDVSSDNEFGDRAELASSSNGGAKNKRTRNKKTASLFFISKDTRHGAFIEILVPVDGSENNIKCEGKGVKLYLMRFGITLDERYLLKMPNFGYFYFVNEVQKDMMDINLFVEQCNEILVNGILREKFDLVLHRNGSSLQRVERHLPSFNGFKVLIDFKLVKDVIEKKNTSTIQIVGMLEELREKF